MIRFIYLLYYVSLDGSLSDLLHGTVRDNLKHISMRLVRQAQLGQTQPRGGFITMSQSRTKNMSMLNLNDSFSLSQVPGTYCTSSTNRSQWKLTLLMDLMDPMRLI
jgi:hypothetical protein